MKRSSAKATLSLVLALILMLACAVPGLAAAASFSYEGDTLAFIQEDGSPFGMFTPQEGTTVALEGDSIVIHLVPKNTTVYNGIHFGAIDDAELTADVAANADGTFDIRLSADKAGTAFPIAPVKAKDGGTTSAQYYMAVPALSKISGKSTRCAATSQALKVDGEIKETEVYEIDNSNYFKLRDVAMLLNGTAAQFGVDYDKASRTVSIQTGEAYIPVGGELATGVDRSASARRSTQTITVDGAVCELIAYNIGGNNFFKLRELGDVLGFYVDYDKDTNTMLVYSEPSEEDQAAADEVAALIDAIYVQERNENTDAQCAAAKAAWDALTDLQKSLVEGEEADPDYFGRDTGDASLDDPRNADGIGEKEILVVSFGTSFNGSRVEDIKSIEDAIAAAYPEWSVRRAFTAQIIINHIQARDGEKIDNMEQAMERAVANGVKTLVIQPTHLMHGAEYDEMMEMVAQYEGKIETIQVAEPLLGEVGADASVINADKAAVAEYVTAAAVASAKSGTLEEAAAHKTAFVFMGHGTSHNANVTYSQMQTQMNELGYRNVFIGTVEGKPASTACEAVIEAVKAAGYTNVILRPLMVVAGDHANNDMADLEDEESWASMFTDAGLSVKCQIEGLGRIPEVQAMYVAHTGAVLPGEAEDPDQAAADAVAALIDAIYVQERNENTDAQCAAAKAAWDALTDAQKELVEGEEADPDYFGRDTGDASLDDPRNADGIGEKEILVVSFGTSFNGSRVEDIKSIEDAIAAAYPEWSVRRAFTAQIIINHIQARDGEKIDNMEQAMERAVANGVKTLVIQPTHLMHGAEYDEMMEMVAQYEGKIETIQVAEPLLGEVGADASVINADKAAVAEYVTAAAVASAKSGTLEEAAAHKTAFVFMGHGTSHNANVTYSQMQTQMNELGYRNVFIGTVEGKPASTACEAVIEAVKAAGYTDVILRPLMVVAGDHANNDMADPEDEESWYSMFTDAELDAKCQIAGLGRIPEVQAMYVAHTEAALAGEAVAPAKEDNTASGALADGTYYAKFNTDSSMFKANPYVNGGKSILTVKDGKMTIHVVLASESIVNLFLGSKEDAQKEGAVLLQPIEETVTYEDGSPDDVAFAFDIPVEALDTDFDCALVGTKGKWYDHIVSVSDVEAMD